MQAHWLDLGPPPSDTEADNEVEDLRAPEDLDVIELDTDKEEENMSKNACERIGRPQYMPSLNLIQISNTWMDGVYMFLCRHAKICWGEEVIASATSNGVDVHAARKILKGKTIIRDGSITAAFDRSGNGTVTSLNGIANTSPFYRAEIVRWVCESMRPFKIVEDRGFRKLMKTGRPGYYIPSKITVSRDVKKVFVKCRQRIAQRLQEYEGALSFATDAWTSPNHKAYIAVTVHFEREGNPIVMLLDLVEVARSHTGIALASEFHKVSPELQDTQHNLR